MSGPSLHPRAPAGRTRPPMKSSTFALLFACAALAACGSSPADAAGPGAAAAENDATADRGNPADASTAGEGATDDPADVYALRAVLLDGSPVDLGDYRGKVTLIVNVASECGYTRQYAGLQDLHARLADRGFAVLGFPSNEFGGQEPGTAEEIRAFCTDRYGVEFPMFAKIETKKGANQSPVYRTLVAATGEQPSWNFCKYLVGKDGRVLGFYPSSTAPNSSELQQAIEKALD